MIQIKTTNNQINKFDEWVKDESGWRDLDSCVLPIRSAGFRGTGEITVEEVRGRIEARIKIGETEGQFDYPPKIEHDQTMNEFRFFVLWRRVEESPLPAIHD